jgi:hypothetical protein
MRGFNPAREQLSSENRQMDSSSTSSLWLASETTVVFPPHMRNIKKMIKAKFPLFPGELVAIGYRVDAAPYCVAGVMDSKGELTKSWALDLPDGPVMMHDMALTEHYALIISAPLLFDPKEMVKSGSLPFKFV